MENVMVVIGNGHSRQVSMYMYTVYRVLLRQVRLHINMSCFSEQSGLFFRPYDGKWSKSMVGYGPEDNHFVVELTYNYGLGSYQLGNDFRVSQLASNCI